MTAQAFRKRKSPTRQIYRADWATMSHFLELERQLADLDADIAGQDQIRPVDSEFLRNT